MSVVVVSWVLVLLAVFGVNYVHDVIAESRMIQLDVERHQLRAWARSGVELARLALEQTSSIDCAILGYDDPVNPFAFPLACGEGSFAVGEAHHLAGSEYWHPGIGDEAARLPVALLDSLTLAALPDMTPHGIEVILQAKETAGVHRLPPFELLPHLDEASLESARLFLSRYGEAVNVNTASAEVLRAVGLPRHAVDKLLGWRAGKDQTLGTTDDQRFLDLDGRDKGVRACSLNSEEAAVLAYIHGSGRLTVESRYFHLAARAWGEGYDGICEIRVVLERPERDSVRIIEWTENWLN